MANCFQRAFNKSEACAKYLKLHPECTGIPRVTISTELNRVNWDGCSEYQPSDISNAERKILAERDDPNTSSRTRTRKIVITENNNDIFSVCAKIAPIINSVGNKESQLKVLKMLEQGLD